MSNRVRDSMSVIRLGKNITSVDRRDRPCLFAMTFSPVYGKAA